jgi:hypothetical protein
MARAYSLDLRERVVAAVAGGESCRGCRNLQGERRERREVVATVPRDRERSGQADGRESAAFTGGRTRLGFSAA